MAVPRLYYINYKMNNDDLRLNSIIKEGKQGDIVIIGCPFDFVRKRSIKKGGQENGPCCLRRFYPKVGPIFNPEFQIDISKVNISDFGNVSPPEYYKNNPQKVINKITDDVLNIIANNKLPFIFGGSKQCSLGSARAFLNFYPQGKLVLMSGLPHLKRAYDNDKLTSQNLLTILNMQFPNRQILFGAHSRYLPVTYQKNFQYISLQEIMKTQTQTEVSELDLNGKPAIRLNKILEKGINYHITLSVELIQRFSGCRDLIVSGIKTEQMTQIFYMLGQKPKVRSIDITQFNPSCEDYQSSLILLNLLYYFLMGWTKRPQNDHFQ